MRKHHDIISPIDPKILFPSLDQFDFLIIPLLKTLNARSIVQLGIRDEKIVEKLIYWVEHVKGELICIDDYSWDRKIEKKISTSKHCRWVEELVENALPNIFGADIYIIDFDYNYYTVLQILQTSWQLNQKVNKPYIALVHGTGWPFANRDAYRNPEAIPEEYRHSHSWVQDIAMEDINKKPLRGGINFDSMAFASLDSGEHNGVLSGIWEFLKDKKDLKKINIPAFFGLSLIFSKDALWADDIQILVDGFHPHSALIAQLEESRLKLIVEVCTYQEELENLEIQKQNAQFNTEAFCQRIQTVGGKKSGLGLVSIIIPTFNRPKLLKLAIESALQQTYRDIEIIVVNDGGDDLQELIVDFHDERIVYIDERVNKGVSAARNSGLKKSKGKYIAYLDDDDFYHPTCIETFVNALVESGYKICYVDTFLIVKKEIGDKFVVCNKTVVKNCIVDPSMIFIKNSMVTNCLFHERECLDKVSLFDETLRTQEDWDMIIRLASHYSFLHIPLILIDYNHFVGRGESRRIWSAVYLNTTLIIHNRYRDKIKNNFFVQKYQALYRDNLFNYSLSELELMSNEEIMQLDPVKIMQDIVQNSLEGTREDMRNVRALAAYLLERFPEEMEYPSILQTLAQVV